MVLFLSFFSSSSLPVVLPLGYRGNFDKRLRNVSKEGNW